MASIKVKLRPSTVEGKEGTLYYQIIHNRLVRLLKTSYKIHNCEWNENNASIIFDNNSERNNHLIKVEEKLKSDLCRIERIITRIEKTIKQYHIDEIVNDFNNQSEDESFFIFMQNRIVRLRELCKDGTADTYATTYKSFRRFRQDKDLLFDEINSDLMLDYEVNLKKQDVSLNSISFYMRILRAVYNYAVKKGVATQQNPFDEVYTSIDKTAKRAISLKNIKK